MRQRRMRGEGRGERGERDAVGDVHAIDQRSWPWRFGALGRQPKRSSELDAGSKNT